MLTENKAKTSGALDAPTVLSRARLTCAISAGKLAGASGRLLRIGGGTSLPGMIARRIDPHVLLHVLGISQARKIVVTGSNGKTTTARLTAALAHAEGLHVAQNRTGSNLLQGVTSVAVSCSNVFGHLNSDILLLEVDEATIPLVVPEVQPDVIVITNIFRDQLDRYGELHAVAQALNTMIERLPASSTVLLNGNDPQVANFGRGARAKRLFFGLKTHDIGTPVPEQAADSIRCIDCGQDLVYEVAYLSHLGLYRCPGCGDTLPKLDIEATAVKLAYSDEKPSWVNVRTPVGEMQLDIPLPGLHNVYNTLAALGAAIAANVSLDNAAQAIATTRPAFGRMERIRVGEKTIYLVFVKNPTSFNLMLRLMAESPGDKHLLLAMSRSVVDGEDFAWLWDVEFEEFADRIVDVVCSGNKPKELAMRLKYADVPTSRITLLEEREAALDAALQHVESGSALYIMSSYTPTLELRRIMQKRGWVKHFWEE